jgi:hypothetical protein
MSAPISVQLDEVQSLAAELAVLARTLSGEERLCRSTARSLDTALGGTAGWWAGGAGVGWAGLLRVLAERTDAVSATLSAAVEAYRRADATLAQRIGAEPLGEAAAPR